MCTLSDVSINKMHILQHSNVNYNKINYTLSGLRYINIHLNQTATNTTVSEDALKDERPTMWNTIF